MKHVRKSLENRENGPDGREDDEEPVTEEFRDQDPEFPVLGSETCAVHAPPL
jgi:hypothetical protein